MSLTTCKLVFEPGTINREQLETLLRKYTDQYQIANFYESMFVGKNRVSFAVVDLPEKHIANIVNNESIIKHYDFMYSGNGPTNKEEECGDGGCCGGGCNP